MVKLLYVAEPSKSPVLTDVKALNSTSIQVEWEELPKEYRLGIITKYVINYTSEKDTGEKNVPAPNVTAVVNGLRQSTKYSFRVLAATVKGNGPQSDPKYGETEGMDFKYIIDDQRFFSHKFDLGTLHYAIYSSQNWRIYEENIELVLTMYNSHL